MIATLVLAAALDGMVLLRQASGQDVPASSAVVDLYSDGEVIATAVTANDGTFSLPLERFGFHPVRITWNSVSIAGNIEVTEADSDELRRFYVLEPTCWAMYGRVRDALTGRPIAGAAVSHIYEVRSDANGYYFIDWRCSTAPFRFHNSYYYWVVAPRYRGFLRFGGRAESISGPRLTDYSLEPTYGVRQPQRPLSSTP